MMVKGVFKNTFIKHILAVSHHIISLPFIIFLFSSWSSFTSFCQTPWILQQIQWSGHKYGKLCYILVIWGNPLLCLWLYNNKLNFTVKVNLFATRHSNLYTMSCVFFQSNFTIFDLVNHWKILWTDIRGNFYCNLTWTW